MFRSVSARQSHRGFTLIELLVVISIISVLIAILLPAMQVARSAAVRTQSLSQSRQISIGLQVYAQSYKQYLPYRRALSQSQIDSHTAVTAQGPYWTAVLYHDGYITSLETFFSPGHGRCPSFTHIEWLPTNRNWFEWRMTDYAPNNNGAMPDQNNFVVQPFRMGDPSPPPSEHLLLFEAVRGSDWGLTTGTTPFSYQGNVVRVYMDGHGVARPGEDMNWHGVDAFAGQWVWANPAKEFRAKPWYRIGMEFDW